MERHNSVVKLMDLFNFPGSLKFFFQGGNCYLEEIIIVFLY